MEQLIKEDIMEQKIEKMVMGMQAFSKEAYSNHELYGEYVALQKEFVYIALGEEDSKMKIKDVCNYLIAENTKYKGVATKEIEQFSEDCEVMIGAMRARKAGKEGERQTFKALETLNCRNRFLRNVELEFDGHKTELDAIVFTKRGVYIIEVKNMGRDVLIDEKGNLQERVSEKGAYKTLYNIGTKMNEKEYVVRQALQASDYRNAPIKSFVVFTNNGIKVQNRYYYITSCFLSNLPRMIDQECYNGRYSMDELKNMYYAVLKARQHNLYPVSNEVQKIKRDFAKAYLLLKAAEERALSKKNRLKNLLLSLRKVAMPIAAAGAAAFSLFFFGKN